MAGRATALAAALLLTLGALAPAARAAGPVATFGTGSASATFNQSLVFSIPVTLAGPVARVEIQLGYPGATGPFVDPVQPPATSGSTTLTYHLDLTGSGHLVPNTVVTATWAVYPQGGGDPVVSPPLAYRYLDTTHDWRTVADGILTVHWYDGTEAFARHELALGLKALTDVSTLLGVTETAPVDFYIYPDSASFSAAVGPGSGEFVVGRAFPPIRTLIAQISQSQLSDPLISVTVPHELTHLVFDSAVGNPYRYPPVWLNEGVAVYESEGYGTDRRAMISQAVASGTVIPLTAIVSALPSGGNRGYLAETEGDSAVDFIVRTMGNDAMVKLVLAYKQGLTDDEALKQALGQDMAAFQAAWYQSIGAAAPKQYGPQPAPPGPTPSDWAAVASPGPGASSPGASGSTGAASSAPSAPAPTSSASTPGNASGSGDDLTLVLAGIVVVSAAVLVGIVVAGRRAASP